MGGTRIFHKTGGVDTTTGWDGWKGGQGRVKTLFDYVQSSALAFPLRQAQGERTHHADTPFVLSLSKYIWLGWRKIGANLVIGWACRLRKLQAHPHFTSSTEHLEF
jgi:hypothetical protein